MPKITPIGSQIKNLREGLKWTQGKLSEETGITIGTISEIENGRREHPHPAYIKLMMKVMADANGATLATGVFQTMASTSRSG